MTDKKISELTSIAGADVSDANDVLPIVDTSVATTKKITREELFKSVSSVDINGGTIDGTVIGGSTPAAISGTTGQFGTSLNVDGTITSDGLTVDGDSITANAQDALTLEFSSASGVISADRTGGNYASLEFRTTDGSAPKLRQKIDYNGDISFYEDTGTTPKFFWDASAEALGIGTSSLDSTLTVEAPQSLISVKSTTGSKRLVFGSDAFTDAFFGTTTAHNLSIISGGIIGATLNTSGNLGIGTNTPSEKLSVTGNVTISGSLSKGSGSFKIDHPIKPDTHHLVHSFIEGPQADNIYRGKVALAGGKATVNLDEAGRMTEGTFVALNSNVQCFTTNEDGWTPVRGKVEGNILTIEAQDATCTDTVSWLVIGERHDQHMIGANWTDEQGRVITEPEKGTAS